MIAEGSQRFRERYRQVGELGHTAFRSAQRSATGLSGSFGPLPCRLAGSSAAQSGEFAQALADVAEAEAWLEPLHQSKDVAFGVAGRIPPPASGVADDQDFAFASPVLQAACFACSPSDPVSTAAGFAPAPRRNAPCRAVPRFQGRVRSCPLLAFERRSWAQWPWACLRPCPARRPRGGRAARARGTRGSLRRTLGGAAGASGSRPPLLRFSRESSAATARTRNWAHVEGLDAKQPPTDQRL